MVTLITSVIVRSVSEITEPFMCPAGRRTLLTHLVARSAMSRLAIGSSYIRSSFFMGR